MRTALLTLVLSLCLLATPGAKTAGLDSIQPVQRDWPTMADATVKERVTVCTAWATMYQERQVWVMAAHCTPDDSGEFNPEGLFIAGKPAIPLVVNFTEDVAIYVGGPRAVPFQLSFATPAPLQPIWSAGFPGNSSTRRAQAGVISAVTNERNGLTVYNLAVAPGASGSPVVDTKSGLVVGMLTQSECPSASWCAESEGIRLDRLREVLNLVP